MNDRNVAALAVLIAECFKDAVDLRDCPPPDQIAGVLASRGVLVPSVLTLDQIEPLVDGWQPSQEEPEVQANGMAELIAGLECIAKGKE